MTSTLRRIRSVLVAAPLLLAAHGAQALVFSLSPGALPDGVGPADLLQSFGGGFYQVKATAAELGLRPGDDITGMHYGAISAFTRWFSVDGASTGLDGTDVRAAVPGQAADVFAAGDLANSPAGVNRLALSNEELGLSAAANIDAAFWFAWQPERYFYLTLAPQSPTLDRLGATPADLLIRRANGALDIYKTWRELGLMQGDQIDAFEFDSGGMLDAWTLLFSLAPGSPTLDRLQASAADVLTATPHGLRVTETAGSLGLNPTDNLDVIGGTWDCSLRVAADCKLPEPGGLALLSAALLALFAGSRRQRPGPR